MRSNSLLVGTLNWGAGLADFDPWGSPGAPEAAAKTINLFNLIVRALDCRGVAMLATIPSDAWWSSTPRRAVNIGADITLLVILYIICQLNNTYYEKWVYAAPGFVVRGNRARLPPASPL